MSLLLFVHSHNQQMNFYSCKTSVVYAVSVAVVVAVAAVAVVVVL